MVLDLLLYYCISIIPTLFLYKNRNRNKKGFSYRLSVIVACVVPAIFYGIRHGVGTDWYTYSNYFNYVSITDSFSAYLLEPGYLLFSALCKAMGLSFYGFSFICCCFLEIAILKSLRNMNLQEWEWIGYFISSFTIYFVAYNLTRQMLATAFLVLAYSYYKKNNKWKSLLLFILAVTFHKTAAVGIIIVLIPRVYKKLHITGKRKIFVFSFALSLLSICIVLPAISALQNRGLFNSTEYARHSFDIKGLAFLVYYIPEWTLLFMHIRRKSSDKLFECFAIFMWACVFQFLGCFYPFVDRISWYFIGFRVLLYPMILSDLDGRMRKQFTYLSVAFFVIYFFVLFFLIGGDGLFPYKTLWS